MSIRLEVWGEPRPSGRPRFRRKGKFVKTHPDPKDGPAKRRVVAAWRAAGCPTIPQGPYVVRLRVLVPRPKTHWTTKGELSAAGRRADPMPPGDVDNYLKLPIDALVEAGAIPDDRSCADGRCVKAWAPAPGFGGWLALDITPHHGVALWGGHAFFPGPIALE